MKEYSIVIVIVSTTGQGDLPANARSFWKSLLRKKLPPFCLEDVQLTTFGLGDRSYPKYNWAARKLHKRLTQLGANEIYPRGEADEQHEEGLDASFVPWASDLRSHLLDQFPLEDGISPIPEHTLLEPKWLLSSVTGSVNGPLLATANRHIEAKSIANGVLTIKYETERSHIASKPPANESENGITVEVQENRRMTPETHWQDVRHLALNSQVSAPYGPGDVLTIYPQNSTESVDEIIASMDWADVADKPIIFVPNKPQHGRYPPPPIAVNEDLPMTLRHLLTNYLDVTAIPRRSFFSLIAQFTTDQFHKDRLLEFTDPKYVDELYDYTTRPRRSILEVLQEFESVKIPWQWAANVLPELRGRQFSIASGGQLKTNADGSAHFELLVAIVKYRTVIKKIREGVCTRYLARLRPGDKLDVSLQRGGLRISKAEANRPIMMIGPGTGLAPLRSLIWERLAWLENSKAGALGHGNGKANGHIAHGDNLLFFGCRNRNADHFYHDEWPDLSGKMVLHVHTAFSRDQTQKSYVQDLIRQYSKEVYHLLHESDGIVYVCGSSGKMPIAVRAALADVVQRHGDMADEAAVRYIETVEKEGRYKQETW